jgi:guanylate kinase
MNQPESELRNPASPLLILISAPSGGGKTTLCQQLLATHPEMSRAVTCTTRAPRAGEREGVDYYFSETAAFKARIEAGDFLEHATVYGHYYGTPKSEVLAGMAAREPELARALVTVFLTPASLSVLEARLRRRGTEAEETLQKRLGVARIEIARWTDFQYLIISTTIAEDLRRMESIIEAERMRQSRARAPA